MFCDMMNEATQRFVKENLSADVRKLALKKAPADVDLPLALRQIEARQILQNIKGMVLRNQS